MKKIKYIIVVIIIAVTFSCGDDYFDVNTPSNTTTQDALQLKDLLEPIIRYTFQIQYNIEISVGQYSQHLASYFNGDGVTDNHYQTTLAGAWSNLYLRSVSNLKVFISKAENTNAIHYKGVAEVLLAINLGLGTDHWGDMPYSQAFLSEEELTPEYDSQESIYTEINNLLTQAISDLSAVDTASTQPGNEDIVYGGDLEKWIKAAYTLKARYALHLTKKNGMSAAQEALSNLQNGFSNNAEDFQVTYNSRTKNPWHAGVVLPNATGNLSVLLSDQLVSLMNGTTYPFSNISIDPRLPLYTDIGAQTEYKGAVNGTAGKAVDDSNANTNFGAENFYSKENAPLVIISYSEALFIKAEAQFLLNTGTPMSTGTTAEVYQDYQDAITANMLKLGVSQADIDSYLADDAIGVTQNQLMLHHIMKEKYIALFLNSEVFVDQRRYDFSQDVFWGLELPVDANPDNGGLWVRRAKYPTSERDRNPDNYDINVQEITTPVWWDN